jgi:effector-binding domain-containing protein
MMNLTETPETTTWPETHYVYIEKIGPFQETAHEAWRILHELAPAIGEHNSITGYMSLYRLKPTMIYRAGVALAAIPTSLPPGVKYAHFRGGKCLRFILTGAYSNLAAACGRVFEIIAEKKIQLRDDYCIENYVTDPKTTPEEQLITQILLPAL